MALLTVRTLLEGKTDHVDFNHLIYKVFINSLVLYIGQSKRNVVTRFGEHLNKPSKLGMLIKLNQPSSLNWQIKFFTLSDCRPFIHQKRLFVDQAWEHFDMDMAERALIEHFRPVVNADFNPNPTPLPPHLKGHHLFNPTAVSNMLSSNGTNRSPNNIAWQNKMRLNGWISIQDENGRTLWKHPSGTIMTADQLIPYQESGTIPFQNKS